ncbi:cytochrome P450 [Periconia macrospinosa]|uniref:Cytochrome P450 n=1 Tax=Periconia macrospinosa TaxID=97972 RepID=A0A2V1DSI3_9PLEO|nr:cytochrome P450 [Periconia macrospinosa]
MALSQFLSWSSLFAGFAGLAVLKFFVTAIYRIYFHPLSKYPGPKLAAATKLYYMYKVVIGEEDAYQKQAHDQYGEVVRLGPMMLSYISPGAWKDIHGHRSGGRLENSKDQIFYSRTINGSDSILNAMDPHEHSKIRKLFSNAFSDKALKLQEPLIRQYVQQLLGNISSGITANPNIHLDVVLLYNSATFDIMGDLTFGEPLGLLENSEYTPWVKAVFGGLKAGTILRIGMHIPALAWLVNNFTPKELLERQKEHFDHSVERVNRRLEKDAEVVKPDFWKLALEKGKDKLTLGEMHANSSVFMIAGTETTATLLSGLTYLLLKNPDKLEKVVKELRSLAREDLSLERLPQLSYLNACFEEALRIYPPIAIGLPRTVAPGGCAIQGEFVPEKTCVFVSHRAAYRSKLNFTRPDFFEPERWLPNSVGYENDRKEVFQPFSFGPRNCIGRNLAYHEMRLIMASILWHFDMELCPESDGWINQKTYTLYEKPDLWVKFKEVRRVA